MDGDTKRPNAALINREWFESACKVLCYEEQGALLVNAVEYVLNGVTRCKPAGKVAIVFEMVKPALDSDIAKYRERCARNAANAKSQSQRVAASGTQSQQVGANTTTTPTTTPTTTAISLQEGQSDREIKMERWLVYGHFWSIGSRAIEEELNAFWSYYESLGWRNNKGAQIVSKVAAARMWRNQYELGTPPDGAKAWLNAVKSCPVSDYNIWHIYAGAERDGEKVVVNLRCNTEYLEKLRKAVPTLDKDLRTAWRVQEVVLKPAG